MCSAYVFLCAHGLAFAADCSLPHAAGRVCFVALPYTRAHVCVYVKWLRYCQVRLVCGDLWAHVWGACDISCLHLGLKIKLTSSVGISYMSQRKRTRPCTGYPMSRIPSTPNGLGERSSSSRKRETGEPSSFKLQALARPPVSAKHFQRLSCGLWPESGPYWWCFSLSGGRDQCDRLATLRAILSPRLLQSTRHTGTRRTSTTAQSEHMGPMRAPNDIAAAAYTHEVESVRPRARRCRTRFTCRERGCHSGVIQLSVRVSTSGVRVMPADEQCKETRDSTLQRGVGGCNSCGTARKRRGMRHARPRRSRGPHRLQG